MPATFREGRPARGGGGMERKRLSSSLQDEFFDRFGKPFFVHSSRDVTG
jgi:hypothetical protein